MTGSSVVVREINPAAPVAWEAELKGAKYLLASGLCPVALKTPEAVLFVVLAGRDLGLSPVASLRGLPTHYTTGEPVRFRCPYCMRALDICPHPGCCGEVHYEIIPESELPEYDGEPTKRYVED